MNQYELGIIGAGNMAEAILRGLLKANFLPPQAILCSDPSASRQDHISSALGVECGRDNQSGALCSRVLLAVKPQMMSRVLAEIAPVISPDALVISIAAGITTRAIFMGLGGRGRIVRAMPNTPMLVGQGMSAIAGGAGANEDDLQWTEKLLGASGRTCRVNEEMMDAVTAVSGSGPAYFFYLIEAMIEAGQAEGLPITTARDLAVQTCLGSAKILLETADQPLALRLRVTSPNGTTQRAIETLDAAGAKETLIRAIRSAAARSRELGK